jgi:uncharacterized membrane protein YhaH (DUF805 family)
MEYYLAAVKRYAVFKGRASKTEYWNFIWINVLFGIATSCLDLVLKIPGYTGIDLTTFLVPSLGKMTGFFLPLYALAVFLPSLAVTVRRLHDRGDSGWWSLLGAIPIVGTIWLIALLAASDNRDDNAYGPVPAEPVPAHLQQQRQFD